MASIAGFLMMIFVGILTQKHTQGVIKDVRLVNGTLPYIGTIEIMEDDCTWKTTCGTNIDFPDVMLICEHLGFYGVNRVIKSTPFEPSPVPTTLLDCSGSNMLSSCSVKLAACLSSSAGAAACHDNSYLGCFMDNANDRVLDADTQLIINTMTIDSCKNHCRSLTTDNYTLAGVENGNECYCGTAGTQYARHGKGDNSDCQVACAGNLIDSCGGQGSVAVFNIKGISSTNQGLSPSDGSVTTTPKSRETSQSMTRTTTMSCPTNSPPMSISVKGISSTTQGFSSSDGNVTATTESRVMSQSTARETTMSFPANSPPMSISGPAAAIGGAVGAVIVIVTIIVVIVFCVVKRKSRHSNKDFLNSHKMTPPHLSTPKDDNDRRGRENGKQSHKYEGRIYNTPNKVHGKSEGGESADLGALYAKVEKGGRVDENELVDFGAIYAVPDKSQREPDGQEETQGGGLYATPDKSLKERQEADGFRHGNKEHSEKNEGLYAISANDSESHDVNRDGHCETDMVENELYTIETF